MDSSKKQNSTYKTSPVIIEIAETQIEKITKILKECIIELKLDNARSTTINSLEWVLKSLENNQDLFNYDISSEMEKFDKSQEHSMIINQFKEFTGAALSSEVTSAANRLKKDVSAVRKSILKRKQETSNFMKTSETKMSPIMKSGSNANFLQNEKSNVLNILGKKPMKTVQFNNKNNLELSIASLDGVTPICLANDAIGGFEYPESSRRSEISDKEFNDEGLSASKSFKENREILFNESALPLDCSIDIQSEVYLSIFSLEFNVFKAFDLYRENLLESVFTQIIGNLEVEEEICPIKLRNFCRALNNKYIASVPYHNAIHGTDVAATIFGWVENTEMEVKLCLNKYDLLAFYTAAIMHDVGHPGTNNAFQINSMSELAMTYNDKSVLENFHIACGFKVIMTKENNIFEKLSRQDFVYLRKRIVESILATDMSFHGRILAAVKSKIGQEDLVEISSSNLFDQQQELLSFVIHSADISHNTKKFEISKKWTDLLFDEFYAQGDLEKQLNLPVSFNCDRLTVDIPPSQVGFIKGVIIPNFEVLAGIFEELILLIDNCKDNVVCWENERQ